MTFETTEGESYVLTETDKPSIVVDKTALKDKLAEVDKFTESLKDTVYTEKSIEAYKETLKSILEDARSVYNDDKATQDDVDGVLSNLTSKFEEAKKLLKKVDTPTPGKPETGKPEAEKPDKNQPDKETPVTGDSSTVVWMMLAMVVAGFGIVIVRRKRRY